MRSALLTLAVFTFAATACDREPQPDAYGNVEATSVVVGAETGGRLLSFRPAEGDRLAAGVLVGTVDSSQLVLEREQVEAQRAASASRIEEIARQIEVLATEREIARRAYERTQRLIARQAATAQQLDQTERDYRVLGKRIEAARAQIATAEREVASADARVALIEDRVRKVEIRNPSAGTVLATYAKAGEFVQTGQPLYKIADLDTVEVRAYVVETQLAGVKIGQRARVSLDAGDVGDMGDERQRRSLPGTVTWISSEAEFTPTPIQTREERADLVYAIKLRVPNQGGLLKIGMPVDVDLGDLGAAPVERPNAG